MDKLHAEKARESGLYGRICRYVEIVVAETEGFEPSVPNSQHDGLANRWFQPLTHVSKHGLNTRLGRDSG